MKFLSPLSTDLVPAAAGTQQIGTNALPFLNIIGNVGSFASQVGLRDLASGNPILNSFTLVGYLGFNGPFISGPVEAFGATYTGFGFRGRNFTGAGNTQSIVFGTGNAANGNSGGFLFQTGTASGTRGKLRFVDGTEGTAGHVWTSTDVFGNGRWQALPASSGTTKRIARAFKTADLNYGAGESVIFNNTQWSKTDPSGMLNLATGMVTISNVTFSGTVRVRVSTQLCLTSVNTFTNWRSRAVIARRNGSLLGADLMALSADYYMESISAGVPASGTSGTATIVGEASFTMTAGEQFDIRLYTNQAITTDSQGFQNFVTIELEQM